MDRIFKVTDVARYLRIDVSTVYRLVKSGKIPAFKIGGQWRFKKAEIDKWLHERDIYKRRTGRAVY